MKNKLELLRQRAQTWQQIRDFFDVRGVLEVETPVLSQHTVTDVHLQSFQTQYHTGNFSQTYYLQTSPEYAMKRLLSQGSGPIFQICKSFRNEGEFGRLHNPEFSMLEWYRPGFDHHQLMDEMDELLQAVLACPKAIKKSYQEIFLEYLNIDALTCSTQSLQDYLREHELIDGSQFDRDTCLQLLLAHFIEPQLGFTAPVFIYDFPSTQAALSKIRYHADPPVAERFEVYIQGWEIANGFHELTNPREQLKRFQADQVERQKRGLNIPEIDQRFIQALEQGIPSCAGVALGLDRLLMIKTQSQQISDVISFSWDEA